MSSQPNNDAVMAASTSLIELPLDSESRRPRDVVGWSRVDEIGLAVEEDGPAVEAGGSRAEEGGALRDEEGGRGERAGVMYSCSGSLLRRGVFSLTVSSEFRLKKFSFVSRPKSVKMSSTSNSKKNSH